MISNASELSELQHWFLTVMTAAGGVEHGMELAQQRYGRPAQHVVKHEHGADATRRMRIYSEGYVLRLLECLQADYPVLHKVMGDALFSFFAKAYIWQHPSTSPTLYDLGAGFSAFLQHSQHAANADMAEMLLLPLELARLERARTEAVRASGLEQHIPHTSISVLDWMLGQEMRIVTPPCLRLLQLSMPLLEFWKNVSHEEDVPPTPLAGTSYLAISRMHYRVTMQELNAWQYLFLRNVQGDDTISMQERLAVVAHQIDCQPNRLLTDLMLWLPVAESKGLVCGGKANMPD